MTRIHALAWLSLFAFISTCVSADDTISYPQQRFGPAVGYTPPKNHPETTVLNVLVRYNEDVRNGISNDAWNAYLNGLFATANQAFVQSGTRIQLKLVGSQLEDVNPTVTNDIAVARLAALRDVEDWRFDLDAHFVTLLRVHQPSHGGCGAARLPACGDDADCYAAATGYSTVSVDVAACGETGVMLAHQIAHNLGAAHEPSDPQSGAYPYSHAHILSDGRGTVMGWAAAAGRIARFSSPGLDCDGEPCGVADVSDNVRTLEQTRHYIARWLTDRSVTVQPSAAVSVGDDLRVAFGWFGVLGDTFDIALYKDGAEVAQLVDRFEIPSSETARESNAGATTVTIPKTVIPGTYALRVTSSERPSVFGEQSVDLLEPPPTSVIAFANDRVVAETSSATVMVERSGDLSKSVSVDYTTLGGSAHAGTNYEPVSGTFTWNAGDTSTRSITVTGLRAAESGNSVSVFVVLRDPTEGAEIGDPPTAEIVIPAKAGGGGIGGGGGSFGAAALLALALLVMLRTTRRRPAPRTGAAAAR